VKTNFAQQYESSGSVLIWILGLVIILGWAAFHPSSLYAEDIRLPYVSESRNSLFSVKNIPIFYESAEVNHQVTVINGIEFGLAHFVEGIVMDLRVPFGNNSLRSDYVWQAHSILSCAFGWAEHITYVSFGLSIHNKSVGRAVMPHRIKDETVLSNRNTEIANLDAESSSLFADKDSDAFLGSEGIGFRRVCPYFSGIGSLSSFPSLPTYYATSYHSHHNEPSFGLFEGCVKGWRVLVGFIGCVGGFFVIYKSGNRGWLFLLGCAIFLIACLIWLGGQRDPRSYCEQAKNEDNQMYFHALSSLVVFVRSRHNPKTLTNFDVSRANRVIDPSITESTLINRGIFPVESVPVFAVPTEPKKTLIHHNFFYLVECYISVRRKGSLQRQGGILRKGIVFRKRTVRVVGVSVRHGFNIYASEQPYFLFDNLSRRTSEVLKFKSTVRFTNLPRKRGDQNGFVNFGKLIAQGYQKPRPFGAYDGLGAQHGSISLLPCDSSNHQGCESDKQVRKDIEVIGPILVNVHREDPNGPIFILGCVLLSGFLAFFGGATVYDHRFRGWFLIGSGLGLAIIAFLTAVFGCFPWSWRRCLKEQENYKQGSYLHSINTVPHKYRLTSVNYRGTVIAIGRMNMANVLPRAKQVAVISALAEGSGIRQIERMTGVNRNTIMNLGVRVGKGCTTLLDRKMRGLTCHQLQFDELWGFIGKKERHVHPDDDPQLGDVWTFCAIDRDTKLVPSFKVGKRDLATANAFVADVASRVKNRVQISSDALKAYVDAIEMNFGADVDFAQIVKTYVHEDSANSERKYSASEIVLTEKKSVTGFPDMRLASTSHVERLNGTTRLHMRRLTRLTYAFSKKLENFEAAVGLHFAYYNFVKRHNTLRVTPAMEAGIESDFWTVENLIEAAA
jgi:IS1 family transposase